MVQLPSSIAGNIICIFYRFVARDRFTSNGESLDEKSKEGRGGTPCAFVSPAPEAQSSRTTNFYPHESPNFTGGFLNTFAVRFDRFPSQAFFFWCWCLYARSIV